MSSSAAVRGPIPYRASRPGGAGGDQRDDDPDACCGDVAGQPGAVTGPFDPDQAHGPESAQPAQQAGVAGRGGGELPDAEQSADGIERGGDVRIGVGVHTAGDGACFFYDGHSHPFLRLRDGTPR